MLSLIRKQQEQATAVMDLKVETSLEKRKLATSKAKHVMEMNLQLQSFLLDLKETRLLHSSSTKDKRKRKDDESVN